MRQSRCGGDLEIPQEGIDVESVALSAWTGLAAYLVSRDVGEPRVGVPAMPGKEIWSAVLVLGSGGVNACTGVEEGLGGAGVSLKSPLGLSR